MFTIIIIIFLLLLLLSSLLSLFLLLLLLLLFINIIAVVVVIKHATGLKGLFKDADRFSGLGNICSRANKVMPLGRMRNDYKTAVGTGKQQTCFPV